MATAEKPTEKAAPKAPKCNVPSCQYRGDDLIRGLCPDVHWNTHRGLADPAPDAPEEFDAGDHPEVSMP